MRDEDFATVITHLRRATAGNGAGAGPANLLYDIPAPAGDGERPPVTPDIPLEPTTTAWGPALRTPFPARIDGLAPHFAHDAGPLDRHTPTWPH
jgi:hypothetical protein